MNAVVPLSEDCRNKLQSSLVITSATQCILELVNNALDSKASSIAVRVNLKTFCVQVVDNGKGMSKDDLRCVGERYMSSKCHSIEDLEKIPETFGYRGCALASIVESSGRVEIQSRHEGSSLTFIKTFEQKASNEVSEHVNDRPVSGTTVTVFELMKLMPVRRINVREVFDLEDIKSQIEFLALNYFNVSFSLRDDATKKLLFQSQKQKDLPLAIAEKFNLTQHQCLVPISNNTSNASVSGYISKELHTDSSIQLIYVNGRIVENSKIHNLVVRLLEKYSGFWNKDRTNCPVVDINGFVFLIQINCPYLSFSFTKKGRKSIVEFQNEEEVLKCIYHAIKEKIKSPSVNQSSVSESVAAVVKEKIGNPAFGPSQLNFVAFGQKASRSERRKQPNSEVEEVLREMNRNKNASHETPGENKEKVSDERCKDGTEDRNSLRTARKRNRDEGRRSSEIKRTKNLTREIPSRPMWQADEHGEKVIEERCFDDSNRRKVIRTVRKSYLDDGERSSEIKRPKNIIREIPSDPMCPSTEYGEKVIEERRKDDPDGRKALKPGKMRDLNEKGRSNEVKSIKKVICEGRSRPMYPGDEYAEMVIQERCNNDSDKRMVRKRDLSEKGRSSEMIITRNRIRETPNMRSTDEYRQRFFDDRSKDGTELAINVPIFDIPDMPQLSFHEFLAWLKLKSTKCEVVRRLLDEFIAFKRGAQANTTPLKENELITYKQGSLKSTQCHKDSRMIPLISLRDVRREKIALRSRLKIKRVSDMDEIITSEIVRSVRKKPVYSVAQFTKHRPQPTSMVLRNITNERSNHTSLESPLSTWKSHYRRGHYSTTPYRRRSPFVGKSLDLVIESTDESLENYQQSVDLLRGTSANITPELFLIPNKKEGPMCPADEYSENMIEERCKDDSERRTAIKPARTIDLPEKGSSNEIKRTRNVIHEIRNRPMCPADEYSETMIEERCKDDPDRRTAIKPARTRDLAEKGSSNETKRTKIVIHEIPKRPMCPADEYAEKTIIEKCVQQRNTVEKPKAYSPTVEDVIGVIDVTDVESLKHLNTPPLSKETLKIFRSAGVQATALTSDKCVQSTVAPKVTIGTQIHLEIFRCDKEIQTDRIQSSYNTSPPEKESLTPRPSRDSFENSATYHKFLAEIAKSGTVGSSNDEVPCGQVIVGKGPPSSLEKVPDQLKVDLTCSENQEMVPDTVLKAQETDWEADKTASGRLFFVNSVTGFSTFDPPLSSTKTGFLLHSKTNDMGIQFLEKEKTIPALHDAAKAELQAALLDTHPEFLDDIKWQHPDEGTFGKHEVFEQLMKELQGVPAPQGLKIASAIMPKPTTAVHKLLNSFQITREDIAKAQVLGQLDRKFIVVNIGGGCNPRVIAVFDQHAVHERIRLEELLLTYRINERIVSSALIPPIYMELSTNTVQIVESHKQYFADNGLSIVALQDGRSRVESVPACFVKRQEREIKAYRGSSLERLIKDLLDELVEYLTDTRGVGLSMPKTIMAVIASEACRGAIKFNKHLEYEEMASMLQQLKTCQFPFQCAHGRPSVLPILDFNDSLVQETTIRKVNLKKFKG